MSHLEAKTIHTQYAPHPALSPYVLCFWTMYSTGTSPTPSIRVLPDGCMDIVLDFTGCLSPNGTLPGSCSSPCAFLTGTASDPMRVTLAGNINVAGIRFRPGGAGPFLGVHAAELTDTNVALADLMIPFASLLLDLAGEAPSSKAKLLVLERLLLERLAKVATPDPFTSTAIALMAQEHGAAPVAELARAMGAHRRKLERSFRSLVGTSPKAFAKILRLRRAIELLRRQPQNTGAMVAADAGYYDQAHFNREFKKMTQTTPAMFQAEAKDVAFVQYHLPALG